MPPPLVRRSKSRPRPFRPIEIAAALGLVAATDIALWGKDGLAAGGVGLALAFAAVPTTLFVAARAWRGSWRLGVIGALLALVILRCLYQPNAGTVVAGLGLVVAFAFALRARSVFVPKSRYRGQSDFMNAQPSLAP